MPSWKISLSSAWRIAASIFFWTTIGFAISLTPVELGKAIGLAIAGVAGTFCALHVARAIRADQKERFALVSVVANASFAALLAVFVATDPGVHVQPIDQWSAVRLAGMFAAIFYPLFVWRRYHQWTTGKYHFRFERKPKLPSPFAILRRPTEN